MRFNNEFDIEMQILLVYLVKSREHNDFLL
jgi:hypothetical protein